MGARRFRETAVTYGVFLTEEQAEQYVAQWRADNPAIVQLWQDVKDAVVATVRGPVGGEVAVGRCLVRKHHKSVRIVLPSGRELLYHAMDIVPSKYGWGDGVDLVFMGINPLTRQWTQQRTYGGRLVENITQAVARDVLADLMLALAARGHRLLGSVHDEVMLEVMAEQAEALLAETLALACTPPAWAPDLPVHAEGFVATRYRKG
jgi:DNA polymerase